MATTETPMTSADLHELRGELRDTMTGTQYQHMDATRYDMEPRGLFSQQPALNPEPVQVMPEQQAFAEPPPPQPQQNWQHLYGQSENEKGEWRRIAQQQSDQMAALQQQIVALQTAGVSQVGNGGYAPSGPAYDASFDPFPERPNSELVNWGEVKSLLRDEILPTMDLRARQAQDAATARSQRMMPQWDVQPQEEATALMALRGEFAGLDQRFTATEVNRMIQSRVWLNRSTNAAANGFAAPPMATAVGRIAPSASPQPSPPVFVDPNRMVRRATYIETAPPAQMTNEPTQQLTGAMAFRADLSAFEQKAGRRATAPEYRDLLIRHGVAVVNDFGPDVSTR